MHLFGGAREKAIRSMAMSGGAPLDIYTYRSLPLPCAEVRLPRPPMVDGAGWTWRWSTRVVFEN